MLSWTLAHYRSLFIVLLTITNVYQSALADPSSFTDTTGNHLWSDVNNWSVGIPEAPIDERDEYAFLSEDLVTTGKYAVIDYSAPSFWAIRLGQAGANARLVMAEGGRLHIGHMIIGSSAHAGAVFEMQGGLLTCEESFIVSHRADPGGVAILRGGALRTNRLTIGDRGVLDIRGGEIIIEGDQRGDVQAHITARRILSYGGLPEASLEIDYNRRNEGKTTLSARDGPPANVGCVEEIRPLTVALMGDPQLHMVEDSLDNVRTAMNDLAQLEHDMLAILGDLVHNRSEYYADYQELIINQSSVPVYSLAGNADRNAGLDAYREAIGLPLNYAVRVRGVRLIFLSIIDTSGGHNHICHIGQEQLDWLSAELQADTTTTTVILTHAPMFETTFRSGDRSAQPPPMSLYLFESPQLRALFNQYPNVRLFASAHIHPFRYGRVDDEGRGGYARVNDVLHTIVGTTANNKGSRILSIGSNHLTIRVRDHEEQRWIDEFEHEYIFNTTLQPELHRRCESTTSAPAQERRCAEGCGEQTRRCDPFSCLWSEWSRCEPCLPDGGIPMDATPHVELSDLSLNDLSDMSALDQESTSTLDIGSSSPRYDLEPEGEGEGEVTSDLSINAPSDRTPSADSTPMSSENAERTKMIASGCYSEAASVTHRKLIALWSLFFIFMWRLHARRRHP